MLRQQVSDNSLDRVQIFFPDPWHKKRHHKRRLINDSFIKDLLPKLKSGGVIHVATDWENYAEQVLEVLNAQPDLKNSADGYAPKPDYRPTTKYEQRGVNLGHGVFDLVFTKVV